MFKYNFVGSLILIDMDNCHVDFNPKYEDGMRKILPPEAFKNQVEGKYWLEERFEPQYHERIHDMLRSQNFFLEMEPMEGAIEAFHEMRDEGLEVMFCTTPHLQSEFCFNEKVAWIHKYLGTEFEEKIITTHDKTVIHGNVLIDDKPEIKGYNKNPSWSHVLFNTHYNQHISTPHRLMHWDEWRKVIYPILESKSSET